MPTKTKSDRETTTQKAARLLTNYRVIQVDQHVTVVIGDHSTYHVSHVGSSWVCNCPWGRFKSHIKPCSHVQAAQQSFSDPASQIPVAALAKMLAHSAN